MTRKEKLVPLNITIPFSLREYAESAAGAEYDSLSDYIRTLIKRDQTRSESEPIEDLVDSITRFLSRSTKSPNTVESKEVIELLMGRLRTIESLLELGRDLRKAKIKRQNPKISEKALLKKLNAWALYSPTQGEVPGLFEISEERKRRLLDELKRPRSGKKGRGPNH